jgi:parvulin-like peptidyl-prolyl isomerase
MASKTKARAPARRPTTRRQRARWQRERRRRRILFGIVAGVVALAVLIPVYGYYREFIARSQEPIAQVDGQTLSVGEYTKLLRYRQLPLQSQANQLLAFGNDASLGQQRQFLAQQIGQLPTQVVFDWADLQVLRAEGAKMGITVTEADIDKELRKRVTGVDPDADARATATAAVTTPSPTAEPSATPTPLPTATPDPETSPSAGAASGTPGAEGTPGATPTGEPATPGPTSTPQPPPDFDTQYPKYREFFGFSDQELRAFVEGDLYKDKVSEAIREQTPKTGPQVDLTLLRLAEEVSATAALARVRGGDDFAAVARAESTHHTRAQGGALGWTVRGTLPAEVEQVAFSLPIGHISDPIKAADGYYILLVNGRDENRTLSETDLIGAKTKFYNDWLEARKKEHQITYFITSDKQLWASDQNKKFVDRLQAGR